MRNKSLDAAKAVAACLVVFIHVSFPGQPGQIIKVFARCAVPFFFMISGYFCYYEKKNAADKIPAKILHILKLFTAAVFFYVVWESLMKLVTGKNLLLWIKELTDIENLKGFLIYNSTSPVRAHLWFLPALIYCYMVDFFIEKWKLRRISYLGIPVLLLMLLWRAEFCRISGRFYHTMEYRNFLFTGMSFYLTGKMLHEYQGKVMQRKPEEVMLFVAAVTGVVVSVFEYCVMGAGEIYAGNVLTIVCLFIWLILYGKNRKFLPVMEEVGRKYAFPVYLIHPAVADTMKILSDYLRISSNSFYQWIRPLLVYMITLFLIKGVSECFAETVHRKRNVV